MSRVALVVDDSTLVRHTVSKFLINRGYAVETASNGLEGLSLLDRVTPELIVANLLMPKMGGAEFIREVRYRPSLAEVLIILVVGRRNSSPTLFSGADHVVFKDIDLDEQLKLTFDKIGPGRVSLRTRRNSQAALG